MWLYVTLTLLATLTGTSLCGSKEEMRTLLFAKLNSTKYSARVRPIKDTGATLTVGICTLARAICELHLNLEGS